MDPVKSNVLSKACGEVSSSNCVIWGGGKIDCIPMCAGNTVTDIVTALGNALCDIPAPTSIDLTSLNLGCLQLCCPAGYTVNVDGYCISTSPPFVALGKAQSCANCPTCPQPTFEKTLVNVLQLIIDKQCKCCP